MSSDPTVIERHAARLNQKAASRVTRLTLYGLLVGGLVGATPVIAPLVSHVHSYVPHRLAYAMVIVGLAGGGYLGHLLGQSRAVALRLQASLALHQLELGRALHRFEATKLSLPAAATLPPPAPAPAPAPPVVAVPPPAPEPAPAPVVSFPAPPPPPVIPAPAPQPAAAAPPTPLTSVPPTFEWPLPQSAARSDAT